MREKHLQAVYYRTSDGIDPVDQFIDELKHDKKQATIDRQIDQLNYLSDSRPHLPFPATSQVEGEFRELRCHYGGRLGAMHHNDLAKMLISVQVI